MDALLKARQALRKAAVNWAKASRLPAVGANDSAFKPVDNALFLMALRYASIVRKKR